MFTIIDRYISKLFLGYFVGGVLVLVTLFLSVDFMSTMVRFEAPLDIVLRYYAYFLPHIIHQMIPIGALMATVFTLSQLNRHNELVALFSSGMSLARVSAAILVWVSMISALSFFVGDVVLPKTAQKKNYLYYVHIRKQPGLYSTVKTGKIWYRSKNTLFNIQGIQAGEGRAQGLTMYYFNEAWELIQMMTASSVEIKEKNWNLSKGTVTLFTENSSFPLTQSFDKKTISMDEGIKEFQSASQASDVLSLRELNRFIQRNKKAGLHTAQYEVDYHAKFAYAFAAFVMSFLGIPFSVGRQRSGGAVKNVGVCLGLAFTYWTFYSMALALGRHGQIPPVMAAWTPNTLMTFLTLGFLLKLKK